LFRGALGDDFASGGPGFGTHVDEVVGFGHEAGVVFDDDDGVALVDETVEDVDEALHVLQVEADAGLLDEVEVGNGRFEVGNLRASFDQLGDEFDPLRFPSRDGWAGLTELEVAEAGVGEELEGAVEFGVGLEEDGCFIDGHFEDVTNRFPGIGDLQGRWIVAFAIAGVAVGPGRGEEVHLEFDAAVSFAGGAAAAVVVEGKARGAEAANAGFGELRKELADVVEKFDIGRRAGTGGLADGRLIDLVAGFDLFEAALTLESFDRIYRIGFGRFGEASTHERGFAAP